MQEIKLIFTMSVFALMLVRTDVFLQHQFEQHYEDKVKRDFAAEVEKAERTHAAVGTNIRDEQAGVGEKPSG